MLRHITLMARLRTFFAYRGKCAATLKYESRRRKSVSQKHSVRIVAERRLSNSMLESKVGKRGEFVSLESWR